MQLHIKYVFDHWTKARERVSRSYLGLGRKKEYEAIFKESKQVQAQNKKYKNRIKKNKICHGGDIKI